MTDSTFDNDDLTVIDELGDDADLIPERYSISSWGADYPVDSLVSRIESDSIYIPPFQREFVWPVRKASRFVESLLLGLPVPGIFLSRDPETQRLLVVDGQQRLRTLQYFYSGIFGDTGREFRLVGVHPTLSGLTYKTLSSGQKILLDDSIIHATIIKQDEPSDGDSSIYSVFERLNTGSMQLTPQEIRSSIYHGAFSEVLSELNLTASWRELFSTMPNKRKRDQELILRFFALLYARRKYRRPMVTFLNSFMSFNRNLQKYSREDLGAAFVGTSNTVLATLGAAAFKPQRGFNAAIFDSVMIAMFELERERSTSPSCGELKTRYEALLQDSNYLSAVTKATADLSSIETRVRLAKLHLGGKEDE